MEQPRETKSESLLMPIFYLNLTQQIAVIENC